MGCSVTTQKRLVPIQTSTIFFTYPRSITLSIHQQSSKDLLAKSFQVTEPVISVSKSLTISEVPVYISFCVLPGLDPHGTYAKACQDACMEANDENSLLLSLFDGHGKQGDEVVSFCCSKAQELYTQLRNKHAVVSI